METNMFLQAARKESFTENGAITKATTGSKLVDQFSSLSRYMDRSYESCWYDQAELVEENKELAFKFVLYLRMITRKIKIGNSVITDKVQNGQGLKDESFKRLLWYAKNDKKTFYNNIWLLPIVGSWKDLWVLLYYDIINNINEIDKNRIFDLINQGLALIEHNDLIKKFMPRIKSKSKLKTSWGRITNSLAKDFANYLGLSFKEYNKLKASGSAHDFQKIICSRNFDKLNWNNIPGKALNILVSGSFIENHNLLDSYIKWLNSQDTLKYTGYVYELADKYINMSHDKREKPHIKYTLDKQFEHLVDLAKSNGKINGNVWCALDTSGSMGMKMPGINTSALSICMSLGIFFSTLNEGSFHKNVIMFDDISYVKKLNGSFTDMMYEIPMNAWGGTNFQSVVDEIIRIRLKHKDIPLSDFPKTLLIVSDMEFNPGSNSNIDTNYEVMKQKLYKVFPTSFVDSMKFIWWNVNGRDKENFPATIDDGGCYMFSGYDGSVISLLLGESNTNNVKIPKSMIDIIKDALNQEILLYVNI